MWSCSQANSTDHYQSEVNIGLANGLVLSGNKPLPGPMLTQIYDVISSHNELTLTVLVLYTGPAL